MGCATVEAAQAGAWETFFTKTNANDWMLYDYADSQYYSLDWSDPTAGVETISTTYFEDNAVSLLTSTAIGGEAFFGDYPAQKVAGIAADVYVQDVAVLDFFYCGVNASGPGGKQFYQTGAYDEADLRGNGWTGVLFSFDDPWYYWDGDGEAWVEVDARSLTAVTELDFIFSPVVDSVGGSRVGLDDVTLEPTVVGPVVATTLTAGTAGVPGDFRMSFTPGPGLACKVEQMRMPPAVGWDAVAGESDIIGPAVHVFQTPLSAPSGIFRVAAEPDYQMIIAP
jgi:hypothetical protein